MKNQDSLAAILFHAIVTALVWNMFESTAAAIYGITALLSTIAVHFFIYRGVFVNFCPLNFYAEETSVSRLITEPLLATANILLSGALLWGAMFFELAGKAFGKLESTTHNSAMNTYESLKPFQPDMVSPELNDSFSHGLLYIAEQFSSVLNIPVISFTILSIIAILLIELAIYVLWLKYKNREI